MPSADSKKDDASAKVEVPNRLVEVKSSGVGRIIDLPVDFRPLYGGTDARGWLLVSGVHAESIDTDGLDMSLEGADRVLGWLKDSAQLGRVLRISEDGQIETALQGVSVFLQVNALPDGRIVYSVMRLGARFSAPFVGGDWGMGIEGTGHFSLRKLGYQFLLPPYAYGAVTAGPL